MTFFLEHQTEHPNNLLNQTLYVISNLALRLRPWHFLLKSCQGVEPKYLTRFSMIRFCPDVVQGCSGVV